MPLTRSHHFEVPTLRPKAESLPPKLEPCSWVGPGVGFTPGVTGVHVSEAGRWLYGLGVEGCKQTFQQSTGGVCYIPPAGSPGQCERRNTATGDMDGYNQGLDESSDDSVELLIVNGNLPGFAGKRQSSSTESPCQKSTF